MKHTLLFLVTLFIVTYVQGQVYEPPDNRQYKEQYLLPEVMTNDNNCFIDFDIVFTWGKLLELQERGYYFMCYEPAGSVYGSNIREDFAQPYSTDTTITIIGLSGYFCYRHDDSSDKPYCLELRDSSNNEIIKSVNVLD